MHVFLRNVGITIAENMARVSDLQIYEVFKPLHYFNIKAYFSKFRRRLEQECQ